MRIRCGKSFKGPNGLKTHISRTHEKAFACRLCDQKFAFAKGLSKHQKTVCTEMVREEFEVDMSKYIYKCDTCGSNENRFASKEHLADHNFKIHEEKVYTDLTNVNDVGYGTVNVDQESNFENSILVDENQKDILNDETTNIPTSTTQADHIIGM